ncbi:MAG: Ig-like domain-containing protein [Oscillospiraceae bacterium]|nr:Ig-like domain-containing protein [Oscillospiraceae bacterium]
MRKPRILISLLVMTALTSCTVKETVDIDYGVPYKITNDKLSKYTDISWVSDDETIAAVSGDTVVGKAPGSITVSGISKEKVVASYTFNVNVVPVTNIVLSTNEAEITVDDGFQLNYSLFPDNASDYGIIWKSADDNVASVNAQGYVLAKNVGQTTISASNSSGVMATCSVKVIEKSAYDRLSSDEKRFVDMALQAIGNFYNSDSVEIKAVEKDGDGFKASVAGQNRFGGMAINEYYLTEFDDGAAFWNWDDLDLDIEVSVKHDPAFDLQLINQALDEKR